MVPATTLKEESEMKSIRIATTLLFMLATAAAFAGSSAQTSFDELKALNGSWEGKDPQGQPVQVDYKVTSNGSALMSEIKGKEDMISMFSLDGERILLTHYCTIGNQPRMAATASPDGKTITFRYVDATNLATADAGHMDRLTVSMLDANHHTEEWVFSDHGKEMKKTFDLWRKQ
jgi:hypothetical protein